MNKQRRAAPGVVTCQTCGAYIGHYVERWNAAVGRWETWLAVGGAVLESAHGVCGACGVKWHWSASSKRLERMIGLVRREDTTQPDDPCEGCEQRWYGECERCELNPKRNKERGDEGTDAPKMLERLQEIGKNLDPEAVKRILGDSGGST